MLDPRPADFGWHVARITFEAVSPLSCGAGEGVDADNAIARDANGLPMVPGATLQGLLRTEFDPQRRNCVFGAPAASDEKSSGRLLFSNAAVHGTSNQAVTPGQLGQDALLSKLSVLAPLVRDHVRLDDRHGADKAGKFDRAAVPAGTRFSFEVLMWGHVDEAGLLIEVLNPLAADWFRIGGGGRRGYGKISIEQISLGFFPVIKATEFRTLRQEPLSDLTGLTACKLEAPAALATIALTLVPVNPWRTGQDGVRRETTTRIEQDPRAKEVDLAPLREPRILWPDGIGSWEEPSGDETNNYVLPGSSVRGPLAHRALFEWNRKNGVLIDPDAADESLKVEQLKKGKANMAQLRSIFGGSSGDNDALASALFFEDVHLDVTSVMAVDHVKIDRFTGGYFPRALYSEELIQTTALSCVIHVKPIAGANFDDKAQLAFLSAIDDLVSARIAIGAKSYGFCNGTVAISGGDAGGWNAAYKRAHDSRKGVRLW